MKELDRILKRLYENIKIVYDAPPSETGTVYLRGGITFRFRTQDLGKMKKLIAKRVKKYKEFRNNFVLAQVVLSDLLEEGLIHFNTGRD